MNNLSLHTNSIKQFIIILFALLFSAEATIAQYSVGARISGSSSDELFGTTMRSIDLTGNGARDLIIGAPGATVGAQQSAGRIYLYPGPFGGDTTLTANQAIIRGNKASARIGDVFTLADFNGNGTQDLAVLKRNFTADGRRAIGIFYGPFTHGSPRNFNDADVTIIAEDISDNFGISISAVPGLHGNSSKHGLLIGASESSKRGNRSGAVYLFNDITVAEMITADQADVIFLGQQDRAFFGISAIARDINGDGETDIIIGAHRARDFENNSGTTHIYFGPVADNELTDEVSDVKIFGRTSATIWGYRLHAFGDVNGNGFNDFSISADQDNSGRLAFFPGRENWPDTLRIGSIPNTNHTHTLFSGSGSNSGTGYSADFSGDYNISGSINPVLGAPRTSGNTGAVTVYNLNGSVQRNLTINNMRQDARFGTSIVNVGPSVPKTIRFDVDDFAVSAPGANATFNNLTNPGMIYVYGGVVSEPNTNLNIQPGVNREIGDSISVRTTYSEGSRPIVEELMVIRLIQDGEVISYDSTFIEPFSGGSATYHYAFDDNYRVNFRYEVTDELGFRSLSTMNVDYAMVPEPFELETDFGDEQLILTGNPSQEVTFLHTASADTNGRNINYQLVFSLDPNGFSENSLNYNVVRTSPELSKMITYNALNQYVRQEYNLNQDGILYWSILATNGVKTRLASNGPRELHFIREGLDPIFNIESGDRRLVIEGFPEDRFTFTWSELQTEDANAFVEYNFILSKDAEDFSNPIFQRRSPDSGTDTRIQITYADFETILEDNNLLNQAKEDTAYLYYSVEAIVNQNPDNNWFPNNVSKKAFIKYKNVVTSSETDPDIPRELTLKQNYPNPFNPVTTIAFGLPQNTPVQLEIFNVVGQRVYSWQSTGALSAGFHSQLIDASAWSSGVYIYRIRTGENIKTAKMLLIK